MYTVLFSLFLVKHVFIATDDGRMNDVEPIESSLSGCLQALSKAFTFRGSTGASAVEVIAVLAVMAALACVSFLAERTLADWLFFWLSTATVEEDGISKSDDAADLHG